ncbi:MAG: formylmethanofuran dehydrogenase subunit C [Methylotenera sp.]|jgi:formylmethanofuran dehydrogenase subunit C|nr:formylmethanofuran dehydrogenase subunit C [Methylotenera sp.]
MTALTFSLKQTPRYAVNCSVLTPDNLANISIKDIANLTLGLGNTATTAGELFEISGSDPQQIVFKNSSNKLDYIGAYMSTGTITVEGDAGAYLGFNLKSGKILCHGNTEAFAACNMTNGFLHISGNTGDFLGAGSDGLRKGMRGGTVIVKGNAGDRAGDQMRRGLIMIEGNAGDYCASRMIAGTIVVLGGLGRYAAFNMHRGTLLLKKTPQLHSTIQDCGTHTLPFLNLLFKSLAKYHALFADLKNLRVQRYVGDAAYKGNGEVLILDCRH